MTQTFSSSGSGGGQAATIDQSTGLAKPVIRVRFGTAGIRGIYGREVSIRETLAVCFAVHQLLGKGRFGVGYDSRSTSAILADVACAAMNWYGSDVDDYGMIPTPVLAFNIKRSKLHAGFSVTASHNPPEYAGVKVYGTDGIEFSLEAEQKLEELMQRSAEYTRPRAEDDFEFGSTFDNEEAIYSYGEAVKKSVPETKKQFRILVDCANGTAVDATPRILADLGHRVITVNSHPSPSFPGRLPEPMAETLGEVADFSRRIGADFTIAHDGDADRLVMIDGQGDVVPEYALSCLLLKIVIERARRGTVIISVNSSNALEEVAVEHGCKVVRSRLGKTFEELYRRRGVYASEPSKIVDARWGFWEDGIYAGVLLSQHLSQTGESLVEALAPIPKYYDLQRNLPVTSPLDYTLVKATVREKFPGQVERVEELDGVKVHFGNGDWAMFRSSGTEKKARVYVESAREADARRLLDEAVAIAQSSAAASNSSGDNNAS